MIRYDLRYQNRIASVVLKAAKPDETALIEYSGDPLTISIIKNWLPSAYGAFGHLIGERTTPMDLKIAMANLPERVTIAMSIGSIPNTVKANIPGDAVT